MAVQGFIFKEVTMKKGELYKFICTTLEANGWVKESKGRIADNEVYSSKGISGKDNILFQMQEYYNNDKTSLFSTTTTQIIGVRPIHTYTPNANLTSAGAVLPSKEMQWCQLVGVAQPPETILRVAYHCNADRLILIVTSDPVFGGRSSIFSVGKLNPLVELNSFSHTSSFCVPCYRSQVGRAASLPNYNHSANYDLTQYHNFTTSVSKAVSSVGQRFATEIALYSAELGVYAKVDNIVLLPTASFQLQNLDIFKDSLKDTEGYTWRLCHQTVYANGLSQNYFAYRIG